MSRPRIHMATPRVAIDRRSDGSIVVRSKMDLEPCARQLGDLLAHWASTTPERTFLAERSRDGCDWCRLTYAQALARVRSVAQALLDRELAGRPVMILSGNGIDHAVLALAAMFVGTPVAPVAPAYSLVSRDFSKLRHAFRLLEPALVFTDDGERFAPAVRSLEGPFEWVFSHAAPPGRAATPFDALLACAPTEAVDEAFRSVGPDTVAKILFTSGSTGLPKGVVNTQRMLCSNQRAIAQCWHFLSERTPLLLDWLPWNHTFGANHNFNMVLHHGGTLFIDDGRPTAELIEATVRNLKEVSPTLYFNVPRGFDMLIPRLEKDEELACSFFRNLDLIFYAGAALPRHLWDHLERLARKRLGREVPFVSAWGATETAPAVTTVHYPIRDANNIGLPVPGCEIKLVPCKDKLEMRVRGPNLFPGYWRQPELTAQAFDEEGFYRIGDAGRWHDPAHPEKGLSFDGRIAEDFKLTTGVWVAVHAIRLRLIEVLAPYVQDAVITGSDRDYVGALVFLNPAGCGALVGPARAVGEAIVLRLAQPQVRAEIAGRLEAMARESRGSSTHVARIVPALEPPCIDAGEITDKGYLNQRVILERRASLVEKLYAEPAHPDVITAGPPAPLP